MGLFKKAKDALKGEEKEFLIAEHEGDGDFEYNIVGEAQNRGHLENLILKHKAKDIGEILIDALLVPEPTNAYDENAIRVLIEEKPVGYIPKNDCVEFLEIFKANNLGAMKVPARIGWDKDSAQPLIGVRLDFSWDE